MAAKKKAAKTSSDTPARPPRQFYITFNTKTGKTTAVPYGTKVAAERDRIAGEEVAGPYVLAERVGNR